MVPLKFLLMISLKNEHKYIENTNSIVISKANRSNKNHKVELRYNKKEHRK
jgi:hypothetical protein